MSALLLILALTAHAAVPSVGAKQKVATPTYAGLLQEARSQAAWITERRQQLHTMPELFYQETKTSAYLKKELDALKIKHESFAGTGLRAFIGAKTSKGKEPRTIALRSDIDGLPIQEEVEGPFKSKHAGAMHACGHDGHMSMLLGAAKLLKSHEAWLTEQGARVALFFQPAEESHGGAQRMISDGVLKGVHAVSGMHVWPGMRSGLISTKPGVIMAASDRFTVSVIGRGGHGAMPHTTHDPVVAASAVVLALQSLVSRETSPLDGAVVTVARFNTGPGAFNVIPDSVELQGTLRALRTDTFERLHTRIAEVANSTAAAYGCSISTVQYSEVPYPPTENDAPLSSLVADVATQLLGVDSFTPLTEPSMAAEDFSFYGHHVPAVFTFLGIGGEHPPSEGLHNAQFTLDESVLPTGAALHAAVAVAWVERQAGQGRVKDEL